MKSTACRDFLHRSLLAIGLSCLLGSPGHAQTTLADVPPDVSTGVPGNLLLTLSVEYPTAVSTANHNATYAPASTYVGYFDPAKCYTYQYDPNTTTATYFATLPATADLGTSTAPGTGATPGAGNYFVPVNYGSATHSPPFTCSGTTTGGWSGNFLNWVTMQSIDPFRWALTGGYRAIDRVGFTVLEKAWASGQGGSGETPDKTLSSGVNSVTPFTWTSLTVRVWGEGNQMVFSGSGNVESAGQPTIFTNQSTPSAATVYTAKARAAVCVAAPPSVASPNSLGETNCTQYGSGYKPEGLIQQYSSQVRFGVMGYLNDSNIKRDAGVLRAQIEFVGPTYPVPGQTSTVTNPQAEWSSTTGQYLANPDASDPTTATVCNLGPCSASGTLQSGVINYLNDFGEAAESYKTYDPVSELYYAAYRYYKYQNVSTTGQITALGNVPAWTVLTTATSLAQQQQWVDGFPVITSWNDPIQYACQKNFILGIGDVNTHASGNVPGTSIGTPPQNTSTYEPTMPPQVAADTSVNSVTVTNTVGALEGILPNTTMPNVNLGDDNVPWCCGDDATYYMAGLAYQAHVQDMRPNDPKFLTTNNIYPTGSQYAGSKVAIQTVSTYWLDVQEDQTYRYQSQFWLAAKYGGFSILGNQSIPPYYGYTPGTPLSITQWASGNNLPLNAAEAPTGYTGTTYGLGDSQQPGGLGHAMPNNYFGAGNAQAMVQGLNNAFASIGSSLTESTTPFAVATPNVSALGSSTFAADYNSSNWSGDVTGSETTFSASNNPTSTLIWSEEGFTSANPTTPTPADELLNLQIADYVTGGVTYHGWDTKRNIVTWNGTNGVPFRLTNLSAAQQAALATVTGASTANESAQLYLNYIRGDRSNEGTATATSAGYRARNPATVLGDIIDSSVTVVAAPNGPYQDVFNPGYSAFTTTYANRTPVVYVGANDGMVHAFNGNLAVPPGSGNEIFAYVPSLVIQGPGTGPGTAATPTVNGLAELGASPFSHHMLVDATPEAFDVDFSYTGAGHPAIGPGNWHTLLIGGLGKGGRGYYAIDVTQPANFGNETSASAQVLWEFTDPRMGFSFGDPNVLKTKKYGWVVIFTSGYNNLDGHGYIFVVNPTNGQLLEADETIGDGGTPTSPSGLTYASGFVANFADNTADSLYAGDLLGNVWRFDLTPAQGSSSPFAPTQFAHVVGPDGFVQPITTRPLIEVDPSTGNTRYVLFGTGQFLASTDISTTHIQSFYSIRDGTVTAFATALTLPTGVTFPITRANLVSNTDALILSAGITGTAAQPEGWYLDLPAAIAGQGSPRVNVDPKPDNGIVVFAANIPNGDVCYPSGTNSVFALDIAAGASELTVNSLPVVSESIPGGMVSVIDIVKATSPTNPNSNPLIVVGTKNGNNTAIQPKAGPAGSVQRLNWREVPTSD
jgi:type IV pilus assembly protein PilY1